MAAGVIFALLLSIPLTSSAPAWISETYHLSSRRDAAPTTITRDVFNNLLLSEQYAAASYCASNTNQTSTKVTCFTKTCPLVEEAGANILLPILNPAKTSDLTGFVAEDIKNNLIAVSFRGTESKKNIYMDVGYQLVPVQQICDKCEASYGFNRAWNDVKEPILAILKQKSAEAKPRVLVTGHSLGGAVASICAAELRKLGYVADMHTFGSPRFGNKALSDFLTTTSANNEGTNYRITHLKDPVPLIPPPLMGHDDIYPEYSITSPTNATVTLKDITVFPTGSAFNTRLLKNNEASAHGWYFNAISACANGTFGEGMVPTSQDYAGMAMSWMESTAWKLADGLVGMGNGALHGFLGLLGMPSNTTIPLPSSYIPVDGLSSAFGVGKVNAWVGGYIES